MMPEPHGGRLVQRIISDQRRAEALDSVQSLPRLEIQREVASDLVNICTGAYSPLEGFMGRADFTAVVERGRLASGLPWTIPIALEVSAGEAEGLGETVGLWHQGVPMALLHVAEVYPHERARRAKLVFGTDEVKHPGVAKVMESGETLVGGPVDLLMDPTEAYRLLTGTEDPGAASMIQGHALTPTETRVLFEEKGWRTIVGFQTRNVPHLGHEYVQKTALTFVDGLFINPVIGRKQAGDFTDAAIIETYDVLLRNYYSADRAVLVALYTEMRYAGPREAIFHALVRKNFGCTHFIVGRDHAGVGSYYTPYAAHDIFQDYPDLGITPLFFKSFFRCNRCGGVVNEKTCPHGEADRVNFSGTLLRDVLSGGQVPDGFVRPEVAEALARIEHPLIEGP